MDAKILKIALFTSCVTVLLAIGIGNARAETYSIKVSCFIPAIAGENIPIVKEQKIDEVKAQQANTPMMLQKETKEIRSQGNTTNEVAVQTVYSR